MSRTEAIRIAKVHAKAKLAEQGRITWGQLAAYVLGKTGRADLSDAIWNG